MWWTDIHAAETPQDIKFYKINKKIENLKSRHSGSGLWSWRFESCGRVRSLESSLTTQLVPYQPELEWGLSTLSLAQKVTSGLLWDSHGDNLVLCCNTHPVFGGLRSLLRFPGASTVGWSLAEKPDETHLTVLLLRQSEMPLRVKVWDYKINSSHR